jgi:hypothetical protein
MKVEYIKHNGQHIILNSTILKICGFNGSDQGGWIWSYSPNEKDIYILKLCKLAIGYKFETLINTNLNPIVSMDVCSLSHLQNIVRQRCGVELPINESELARYVESLR